MFATTTTTTNDDEKQISLWEVYTQVVGDGGMRKEHELRLYTARTIRQFSKGRRCPRPPLASAAFDC